MIVNLIVYDAYFVVMNSFQKHFKGVFSRQKWTEVTCNSLQTEQN